jgi:altronate dehydratase
VVGIDLAKAIRMDAKDNVATLLANVDPGDIVAVTLSSGEIQDEVKANQRIPFGHKISIKDIHVGEKIIKYGEVIGEATLPIPTGDHVHIHNIRSMTWGKFG